MFSSPACGYQCKVLADATGMKLHCRFLWLPRSRRPEFLVSWINQRLSLPLLSEFPCFSSALRKVGRWLITYIIFCFESHRKIRNCFRMFSKNNCGYLPAPPCARFCITWEITYKSLFLSMILSRRLLLIVLLIFRQLFR